MKSISPLESARNGFETLVKLDRTDSGKLNVPSPHGSFQRTQSFIKQILSMKTDLNALFPTENKDKSSNFTGNNFDIYSPSNDTSDLQYSSSRSYGMYRKKNVRSVKLAPLTPEFGLQSSFLSSSTKSATDLTPASSHCLTPGMAGFASSQASPADHSRLRQEMMHSPSEHSSHKFSYGTTTQSSLHFSDHDDLISDNCSIMAVQSDDDYHYIHERQCLPPSNSSGKKNHKKSVSLDSYEDPISQVSMIAPLRAPLPHISPLHSSSTDTACLQYNYHTTISQVPSSWSSSTDVYDEMDIPIYEQIRTKSFNGEGLVMKDQEDIDEKSIEREKNQITAVVVRVLTDDKVNNEENRTVESSVKLKKQIKRTLFPSYPSLSSASSATPVSMSHKSCISEDDCAVSTGTVPDYDQQAEEAEYEFDNEEDLIPNDPDEDDAQCEVERYLQSYCLGKDTSATTALQAFQQQLQEENDCHAKSNNDDDYDEETSPINASPVSKKSVKSRKSTGKMAKKSLTITNFDDDDDDDNAYGYSLSYASTRDEFDDLRA